MSGAGSSAVFRTIRTRRRRRRRRETETKLRNPSVVSSCIIHQSLNNLYVQRFPQHFASCAPSSERSRKSRAIASADGAQCGAVDVAVVLVEETSAKLA